MISVFPAREVALEIGSFSVRWYGLLYVAGFWLAWYLLPKLAQYRNLKLSKDDWATILAWALVGVVVGGRLGYVLLYESGYFLAHPAQIFAIWDGGMASHGGFIGVGLALLSAVKKVRVSILDLLDVVVIPAALALALGRVGNFINQELFNPPGLALLAVAKDFLIAVVCFMWLRRSEGTHGQVVAAFLVLYGILRFLVEFWRVQEFSGMFGLTRGQLYSLPIILAGVSLILWRHKLESVQK